MFERQAAGRYGSFVQVPAGNEPLILRCIGRNPEPLKDFLRHCKEVTKQSEESKTAIFSQGDVRYNQGMMWVGPQLVLNRPLDTIELDDHTKTSLVQDVEDYLKPKTREYYAINGIPYRRGYLFHGPPGTGKSSFCRALAGHFRLELYMLSLASNTIDEATLIGLFQALPTKCLVLLEDIDSAGIVREETKGPVNATELLQADTVSVAPPPPPPGMSWPPAPRPVNPGTSRRPVSLEHLSFMETKSVITLSTLLNVIDGTAAKEGRILVMTTNSPESLDKALIRPGRIDKQILFPPMSCRSAARIFTRMLGIGRNHDNVAELAEQFAAKLPDGQITPAEVQGFLLDHRNDPEGAVKDVAKWSAALLEAKELGKNVIELSDLDESIEEV